MRGFKTAIKMCSLVQVKLCVYYPVAADELPTEFKQFVYKGIMVQGLLYGIMIS